MDRYPATIQKTFGQTCDIRSDQIARGFYHLLVPQATGQRLFGTQQEMTFTGANSFSIRARTHEAPG